VAAHGGDEEATFFALASNAIVAPDINLPTIQGLFMQLTTDPDGCVSPEESLTAPTNQLLITVGLTLATVPGLGGISVRFPRCKGRGNTFQRYLFTIDLHCTVVFLFFG